MMSAPEAEKSFRQYFPGHSLIKEFLDPQMSALTKTPHLDPFKLDNYLHEKHGDYESRGQSMADLITAEYGPQAMAFIKGLI